MNKAEKEKFVRDLMSSITTTILEKVADMPDEWDGHEIREYIADKTREMAAYRKMNPEDHKAYRNEVIVRNL